MSESTTGRRLAVGVAVATLLHFVVVPGAAVLLIQAADASAGLSSRRSVEQADELRDARRDPRDDARPRDRTPSDESDQPPEPEPDRDKVQLGMDDAPERVSMAWIAYEDYVTMQAPQSDTLQPATQTQVDPTPLASMPEAPTPPAPIAREPQPLAMAQPGGSTAQASAQPQPRSPSESLVKQPGPAVNQPPVETSSDQGNASRNQVGATAPMEIDKVPPADQPAADARLSAMGDPSQQDAVKPVDVPATEAVPGSAPRAEGDDLAMVNREHATGPDVSAPEPMAQTAARTDEPDPAGVPTQRDPAESPADEDGTPVARIAAVTPSPDPLGAAATNRATLPRDAAAAAANTAQQDDGSAREVTPAPENRDRKTTPPAAQSNDAQPTAAPRTESESPPASPDAAVDVRPGQVLAAAGIEIRTATPQFSLVTRITALPVNPLVRVTFNRDGEVIDATILKSTGYDSVDSPILSSLYKWKATGKKLEERGKGFSQVVRLKLVDE